MLIAREASAIPFAAGERPEWSLENVGDGLVLRVAGRAPVQFDAGRWTSTPQGRELTAVARDGRMMKLLVVHAICPADPDAQKPRLAAKLLFEDQRLLGCLVDGGRRPYPGR